jgi:hypothetical protein
MPSVPTKVFIHKKDWSYNKNNEEIWRTRTSRLHLPWDSRPPFATALPSMGAVSSCDVASNPAAVRAATPTTDSGVVVSSKIGGARAVNIQKESWRSYIEREMNWKAPSQILWPILKRWQIILPSYETKSMVRFTKNIRDNLFQRMSKPKSTECEIVTCECCGMLPIVGLWLQLQANLRRFRPCNF